MEKVHGINVLQNNEQIELSDLRKIEKENV